MIDFGDYVEIEQKRYRGENEMFMYKVISGGNKANYFRGVPVDANDRDNHHGNMADVVKCIQCGVSEDTVETFRLEDVRLLKSKSERENQSFTG